ncbi:MAG: aspartate--tRNA(Asn) ligase [Candidatus Methanofastidiosia archaeon]
MMRRYTDELEKMVNEKVYLCGWVSEIRDLGGIKFLLLRDRKGVVQITAPKSKVSQNVFDKFERIGREYVLGVSGVLRKAEKAHLGVELIPDEIEIISEASSPLPMDPSEKVKADFDTRLDNRFLDLRRPEAQAIFKIRSELLSSVHEFLRKMGFLEIHTPNIISSASEGGTELFPIQYFERKAFLSQSPQLYKQMMMAAGFDKVYEIAKYFRAEEHNTSRHINESTAIDLEMSFIDSEEDVMHILEGLVNYVTESLRERCSEELEKLNTSIKVPQVPFKRITYDEALELISEEGREIEWGEDLGREGEKILGEIMAEGGNEYYFIKRWYSKKVFYLMPEPKDEREAELNPLEYTYCRSFDLDCKGVELTSGGQRIHDHALLVERIKTFGLNPKDFSSYLEIFKYGIPPHGGFGFGIERFLMELLNLKNIRECILFPRDRKRLTP